MKIPGLIDAITAFEKILSILRKMLQPKKVPAVVASPTPATSTPSLDEFVAAIEKIIGIALTPEELKIVESLHMLATFNFSAGVTAVTTGDIPGILNDFDSLLYFVGLFFAPAATAAEWLSALEKLGPAVNVIIAAYKAGLVRGIDYTDPNYNAPAGSNNITW